MRRKIPPANQSLKEKAAKGRDTVSRPLAFIKKPFRRFDNVFCQKIPRCEILLLISVRSLIRYLFLFLPVVARAQTPPTLAQVSGSTYSDSPFLDSLLRTSPALAQVLSRPGTYQYQIIYTRIDRDAQNVPHFTQHTYHLNPRQYFNPASLVKLPVALLALEKLHTLPATVTRSTIMSTGATWRCQTPVPFAAPADSDRQATVGNYIKRMLLVSDNLAYNRLYEFLGQQAINARLQQLGYAGSRIVRRFAPCDTAANRHTNPIAFHTATGDTLYKQPAQTNPRTPAPPLGPIFVGRAYQVGSRLIRQPYEFTTANNLPLPDISALLQTAIFPAVCSRFPAPPPHPHRLRLPAQLPAPDAPGQPLQPLHLPQILRRLQKVPLLRPPIPRPNSSPACAFSTLWGCRTAIWPTWPTSPIPCTSPNFCSAPCSTLIKTAFSTTACLRIRQHRRAFSRPVRPAFLPVRSPPPPPVPPQSGPVLPARPAALKKPLF